ncbi:MAG: TRIC cation channel family protein [Planctomycetota bacterium]|nr:TRIC cation channel family protein [Planctomycetota bacterium]
MEDPFLLPPFIEYFATFLYGVTGALLGARRGYAILGILSLAIVSATGGGLLRDGLFLQHGPPVLVRSPEYLYLSTAAGTVVMLFGRRVQRLPQFDAIVGTVDALGLGAYAVVGMDRATAAGLSSPGVVVVGMVNAVGGSLLRDVLIRREPNLFRPGTLEESAAFIGCLTFLAATRWTDLPNIPVAWFTIGLVFLIRILAIRYQIQTRPLRDFEEFWKERGEN